MPSPLNRKDIYDIGQEDERTLPLISQVPKDVVSTPLEPPFAGAYSLHNTNSTWVEGLDIGAAVVAIAITLGPLTAYTLGWGA